MRNVLSTTAPDSSAFSFVRTNAPPFPGFTCWNSTIRQTSPSSSMCIPFRNWFVETVSAMAAVTLLRGAPSRTASAARGRPASRGRGPRSARRPRRGGRSRLDGDDVPWLRTSVDSGGGRGPPWIWSPTPWPSPGDQKRRRGRPSSIGARAAASASRPWTPGPTAARLCMSCASRQRAWISDSRGLRRRRGTSSCSPSSTRRGHTRRRPSPGRPPRSAGRPGPRAATSRSRPWATTVGNETPSAPPSRKLRSTHHASSRSVRPVKRSCARAAKICSRARRLGACS